MGQTVQSPSQPSSGQAGQDNGRASDKGRTEIVSGLSTLAAKQNILGLIDPGREIRRPPLVGMQFLHEGAVGQRDIVGARAGLKAKDLIGLLLRHFSPGRNTAALPPRCRITLRVRTPAGLPAVKIRSE
jgi:hypothetical protein